MKSILLHVQNDDGADARLQLALALARAFGGHITCLHVTSDEPFVALNNRGGISVMSDIFKLMADEELRLRARIEQQLASEDVSWHYVQITGKLAPSIITQASLADVVVVGRETHKHGIGGLSVLLLGKLLHRLRTPMMIAGTEQSTFDPFGAAMIGWNGSYEAANAVRAAVPLLKLSRNVQIIRYNEEHPDRLTDASLLEYLSRHEIHAELRTERIDLPLIPASISAHARSLDAAYLVLGGYGRTRVGELLFGGVTREMLTDATMPILMTH